MNLEIEIFLEKKGIHIMEGKIKIILNKSRNHCKKRIKNLFIKYIVKYNVQ